MRKWDIGEYTSEAAVILHQKSVYLFVLKWKKIIIREKERKNSRYNKRQRKTNKKSGRKRVIKGENEKEGSEKMTGLIIQSKYLSVMQLLATYLFNIASVCAKNYAGHTKMEFCLPRVIGHLGKIKKQTTCPHHPVHSKSSVS